MDQAQLSTYKNYQFGQGRCLQMQTLGAETREAGDSKEEAGYKPSVEAMRGRAFAGSAANDWSPMRDVRGQQINGARRLYFRETQVSCEVLCVACQNHPTPPVSRLSKAWSYQELMECKIYAGATSSYIFVACQNYSMLLGTYAGFRILDPNTGRVCTSSHDLVMYHTFKRVDDELTILVTV